MIILNLDIFWNLDLEYPKELHDAHNAYPLAPELVKIKGDMLSSKNENDNSNHKTIHDEQPENKVISNDKTTNIIHERSLTEYLDKGKTINTDYQLFQLVSNKLG